MRPARDVILQQLGISHLGSVRCVILLDLEFTCWESSLRENWSDPARPPEVIEIAMASYDVRRDHVIDRFSSFVRPRVNPVLSAYCKDLVRVSQETIDEAPPLADVNGQAGHWLAGYSLARDPTCAWGFNDRLFLAEDAKRSRCVDPLLGRPHLDLRCLTRDLLGSPGSPDATYDRDAVRAGLGLSPNPERHRAMADALDLIQFLRALRQHPLSQA